MSYWQAEVTYYRGDESYGAVTSAHPTRETALTAAFCDASYYLLQCGYPKADASIKEFCSLCHGEGVFRVKMPRSVRVTRCKECKGHKGMLSSIGPFPVRLSMEGVAS